MSFTATGLQAKTTPSITSMGPSRLSSTVVPTTPTSRLVPPSTPTTVLRTQATSVNNPALSSRGYNPVGSMMIPKNASISVPQAGATTSVGFSKPPSQVIRQQSPSIPGRPPPSTMATTYQSPAPVVTQSVTGPTMSAVPKAAVPKAAYPTAGSSTSPTSQSRAAKVLGKTATQSIQLPMGSTSAKPMQLPVPGSITTQSVTPSGTTKVISLGNPVVTSPRVVTASQPATVIGTRQRLSSEVSPLSGPESTVKAYESKHAHDEQLANLKEVRKSSGLKKVPVLQAVQAFKAGGSAEGKLGRSDFTAIYEKLLEDCGHEPVTDEVKHAVFDLFDRDDNDVVDMMEIVCGVSLLCKGSDHEKVEAVFQMFDENGDGFITADEMFKFLSTVFKVVCTPKVMELVNTTGVNVETPEDMASATTLECFKYADLNHDGRLSLFEFKKWFTAPRTEPGMLFTPLKKMLN